MVRTFVLLTCLFGLLACSSGGRQDREDFKRLVLSEQWDQALAFLDQSPFYQEPSSKLLYLLEKGSLLHRKGDFFLSSEVFQEARQLSQELYTRSLSSAAKTLVANDNYDLYYGAPYERSMIHYFQALNFYFLYLKEKDVQRLYSARAEAVAWDALLQTYRRDRSGAVYKEDLLARLIGGVVHELLGSRDEKQIALQLYKDALDALLKYYAAYEVFNKKSESFVANYLKLSELSIDKVRENYLEPTTEYQKLENFLKMKIVDLTHELFPRDVKRVRREFSIPEDLVPNKKNVIWLLEEGLIPSVVGAKQYFGLDQAQYDNAGAKLLAGVSAVVLSVFATETLGLQPPPDNWNPVGAQVGLEVTHLMAQGLGIEFELPAVEAAPSPVQYEVVFTQAELGKTFQSSLVLVQPMGDIARQAVAEDSWARYTKVGLRVALKHLSAIVASYGTYKLLSQDDGPNFLAKNAAVIQYLAAAKGIAASEKADTRHWLTLPRQLYLAEIQLESGEYHVELKASGRSFSLPSVAVGADSGKILQVHRLSY